MPTRGDPGPCKQASWPDRLASLDKTGALGGPQAGLSVTGSLSDTPGISTQALSPRKEPDSWRTGQLQGWAGKPKMSSGSTMSGPSQEALRKQQDGCERGANCSALASAARRSPHYNSDAAATQEQDESL